MFIKYKPSYRKIAMGLLSYMEKTHVKDLQETINRYEEDESWQLFLWKENEDIIGVLGVRYTDGNEIELKHICVNPSYREEGIGKKMVQTIKERLDGELTPCEETANFFGTCEEQEDNASLDKEEHVKSG